MPRGSRLALWCLALLLSLSLYLKGRVPADKGEDAAFLRPGANAGAGAAGSVTVRLAQGFPRPGVYRFPDGTSLATATKMTVPAAALPRGWLALAERRLRSGDVITLTSDPHGSPRFTVQKMGVKELMLLGIPLDPDLLNAEEWALLPGIGPVLAGRIVSDRHKNGAFGSLEGLLRVPGIGPGRLSSIRRYF